MTQHNTVSAQGTKGFLIWSGERYYFRVYHDKGFIDYDILHSDLEIEIVDADAAFYDDRTLDHSPETLGLTKDDNERTMG